MKANKQRLKIAEARGWTNFFLRPESGEWSACPPQRMTREIVPDYLNDLNAMHKAEMALTPEQRDTYGRSLDCMSDPDRVGHSYWSVFADATQRAEAFLKTLDLWEDEK